MTCIKISFNFYENNKWYIILLHGKKKKVFFNSRVGGKLERPPFLRGWLKPNYYSKIPLSPPY
jgi:hypothetical protein